MKTKDIVLIPGDGIGPEITIDVKRILAAAGANINWIERQAGIAALALGEDVFHNANIMKLTDGLFIDGAENIHKVEYPNIEYQSVIIDAGGMKMV